MLLIGCTKDSDGEDQLKKFTISISVTPLDAGRVSGLVQSYNEGSVFTITALPYSRYAFVEWTGSIQSTDNPVRITMDSNKVITAVF